MNKLIISKIVADEILNVSCPISQIILKEGILSDFTIKTMKWIYRNEENELIAIAYANPLTRDLVTVIDERK